MLKTIAKSLIIAFALIGISLPTSPVFANVCDSSLPADVREANGCNSSKDNLSPAIQGIINGVIGILSIIAVVFIVVGGVQYMTSGGDSGKVKTAKNTILYALIGLVICVLAFAIVNWLIGVLKSN
ncbi:hypothetical protein IKE87_02345 [Candidatus Saccharibacteria bacterium]|nr:hypothetical protein [Candidatus Saccharibacteria bacterium]